MIRLFTSYYEDQDKERDKEIKECLKKNIENRIIDEIVLISEVEVSGDRCKVVMGERPTYDDFFKLINEVASPDDISIIANSDIYFDKSIGLAAKMGVKDCYTLSRWDVLGSDKIQHHNFGWSQDVWIFKGQVKTLFPCGFHLGIPGCDNSIAYWLMESGYDLTNPSFDIIAYHLHLSGIRRYDDNNKIPPPYHLVFPTQYIKR